MWARNGLDEEFDLENTIASTARSGFLDIKTRPEKENAVKILISLMWGDQWTPMFQKFKNYFLPQGLLLNILNTIIFIIAYTSQYGKTISEEMKIEFSRKVF